MCLFIYFTPFTNMSYFTIQTNLPIQDQFYSTRFMSKNFSLFLTTFICLFILIEAEVTYASLKGFWESTYDTDKNGEVSLDDFVNYFRFMQPDHNTTKEQCEPIFNFFDSDLNKIITLDELIRVSRIKISYNPGHKQIHLGLTAKQAQMQVIWVSNPQHYNQPIVEFGRVPGMLKNIANGTYHTYDVGKLGGFHGRIYVATMKGLEPVKRYYYRVGDRQTKTFSKIKSFTAPPLRTQTLDQLNIAVFGDMGTFAPFGNFVIDKIAKDHLITPFNFVLLTGDVAYAGVNSYERGQSSPIWDLFGELTEKFAAYTAFMPGNGNHESYYNYTAYFNRYILPRSFPQQTNFYFSFDYGQVHVIHFSSEHPYSLGSEQYNFLERDLQNARNNPNIEWIIVGSHRTFYSSNLEGYSQRRQLAVHLQDMMYKYKVDIVQNGHLHNYERTYPVYMNKAFKSGVNYTHYIDPQAPVYMTQGTAGALIKEKFLKPAPQWAVSRQDKYGYGRIIIKGNQLKYQFISIPAGKISDEFTIVKTVKTDNKLREVQKIQTNK